MREEGGREEGWKGGDKWQIASYLVGKKIANGNFFFTRKKKKKVYCLRIFFVLCFVDLKSEKN